MGVFSRANFVIEILIQALLLISLRDKFPCFGSFPIYYRIVEHFTCNNEISLVPYLLIQFRGLTILSFLIILDQDASKEKTQLKEQQSSSTTTSLSI